MITMVKNAMLTCGILHVLILPKMNQSRIEGSFLGG
jgi:hypothetical protein